METVESVVIRGIVRDGVVVPESDERLREGDRVSILVRYASAPDELAAETAAWDRASDAAWAMIGEWEREESK
jgi:hypothetical protein